MEDRKSNPTTILVITLCLAFLILSASVESHSSKSIASSPSPSPAPVSNDPMPRNRKVHRRRDEKGMKKGSIPAACHSKCNRCKPCIPVEVSIQAVEADEHSGYYPQVWKCMCQNILFSP